MQTGASFLTVPAAARDRTVAPAGRPPRSRGPRAPWLVAAACAGTVALGLGYRAVATRERPAHQVVNGAAEGKRTSTGAEERWRKGDAKVVIDPSVGELGAGADEAVMEAFATWHGASDHLPHLSFDRTSARSTAKRDGVNRVLVAPIEISGHRNDLAITVAWVEEGSGAIVEADVIINSRHAFAVLDERRRPQRRHSCQDDDDERDEPPTCRRRYDLQNVLTHEAGHFFGLGEDDDDGTATMFRCSSACEVQKRELTGVDSSAIAALYVDPPDSPPAAGCSLARGPDGPAPAWAVALAGLAFLRRRRG